MSSARETIGMILSRSFFVMPGQKKNRAGYCLLSKNLLKYYSAFWEAFWRTGISDLIYTDNTLFIFCRYKMAFVWNSTGGGFSVFEVNKNNRKKI